MTFNFLRPGLTVNIEARVQEQIILDSSVISTCLFVHFSKNRMNDQFKICNRLFL